MARKYKTSISIPEDEELADEIAEEMGDILVEDEDVEEVEVDAEPEPEQSAEPNEETLTLEDLLERIEETEREVREREANWNLAKQEVKIRKGALDDAVLRLRELCRAREHDAARPLFSQDGKAKAEAPQEEEWRSVAVETLDIPNSTIKKLAEAKITTMGEMADYTAAGNQLVDIAGIGPAKAEQLEDACLAFWRDREVAPADHSFV